MDWWFLRTTTPKPTTSQQSSMQVTTHVPLNTQSVPNPPVMMQQETYPDKELVSSKNQVYPWERQRELLVPFSESARTGKGPQLEFNDKNISVDTWTTTTPPEVQPPPTLRPFPPVMPGASFYVDQHVSHGHFGREADSMPVVYDPNVLQSRYGFSGMLPLSHLLNEQTNKLLVDSQPKSTYHQKKIRKPTTFGVQNLPIGNAPHSKVRFPVSNQYFVDFSKAAYFFIPPPVKLSTAKAIKIRAQARPSFVIGTAPPVTWTSTPTTTVVPTTTSEIRRTMAMFGDHLNWRPLGTGPRKFGAAKLIPLAEFEGNPELNQNGLEEENKFGDKSATGTERRIDIESYDDFSSNGSSKCLREDPMHLDDLSPALIPAVKACFMRTRECLLHEVTPLERRINFNEEQCINFCGQHAYCNSVVYSKSMAICDIFNLRNGTANAHLVHHHDYHYYEPKQWANGTKAIENCWQGKIR
ncbi:hypothetical protein DdX_00887 [Ditylenchus destructor]|uniref:Apple domain-containing protein n=1 Tax=Ditylenchus destructor TaxID=166010 RepID=A0AAD4R7N4_9BILA|nr:hypothetical protein DdX_00887 [Ditylenchus destructor]